MTDASNDRTHNTTWISLGACAPSPTSPYVTNLFMASATLRRTGREGKHLWVIFEWTTSTGTVLEWTSSDEVYPIRIKTTTDMSFTDGQMVEIILSASTDPNYTSEHMQIEAIEVASGVWELNMFGKPQSTSTA